MIEKETAESTVDLKFT
jgi:hypothetical protein